MKTLEKTVSVGKGERMPTSKATERKADYSCGQRREKMDHLSQSERAMGVWERGEPTTSTGHWRVPCGQTPFQECDTGGLPEQRVEDLVTLGKDKDIRGNVCSLRWDWREHVENLSLCQPFSTVCRCALSNGLYDSWAESTVGTLPQKIPRSHIHTGSHLSLPFKSPDIMTNVFALFLWLHQKWMLTGCKEAGDTHPDTNGSHQSPRICWSLPCSSSSIALKVPEATVRLVFYHSDGTPVFSFPAHPASTLIFSHSN